MIDFTKAEIGQHVYDPQFGNGGIVAICNSGTSYPITVNFEFRGRKCFTRDGRASKDRRPTLCVGHRDPIDQGELPEQQPKPLEWKGEFVWAYVSNVSYEDAKKAGKRRVINYSEKENCFYAISDGISEHYDRVEILAWKYAWEIPEGSSDNQ